MNKKVKFVFSVVPRYIGICLFPSVSRLANAKIPRETYRHFSRFLLIMEKSRSFDFYKIAVNLKPRF
jgi:hypothetical protein